jgi:peptide-methionine (S)-S-oxide reductase
MNYNRSELATLGGGCFWCLEAVFEQVEGVKAVAPGYFGGHIPFPSYEDVCGGTTGHAEVVQVEFDPIEISYEEILDLFFAFHVFFHTLDQKTTAERVIKKLESSAVFDQRIVTAVEPFGEFFLAEEYHMNYYRRNPGSTYCQAIIAPKMVKLRNEYRAIMKTKTPS